MENFLIQQIEESEKISVMYRKKIEDRVWRISKDEPTREECVRGFGYANGKKQAFTQVLAELKGYSIEDTRLFIKHRKEGLI